MPTLRLLSVNARTLTLDQPGLARLIEAQGADVVCVHGAPSLLRWRSICAALARRAGLVVVGGGRTGGGNLLMSTLGVDVEGLRDVTFAGTSGVRPAGATLAALRLRGSDLVVAGARLLGEPATARAQALELQQAVGGLVPGDTPAVVCVEGASRGTPAAQLLGDALVAVADGVFVDARIGVGEPDRSGGAATVLLELALPVPVVD